MGERRHRKRAKREKQRSHRKKRDKTEKKAKCVKTDRYEPCIEIDDSVYNYDGNFKCEDDSGPCYSRPYKRPHPNSRPKPHHKPHPNPQPNTMTFTMNDGTVAKVYWVKNGDDITLCFNIGGDKSNNCPLY